MNLKVEISKEKATYIIIAVFHFILSFFLDTFIFRYNIFTIRNTREMCLFVIMKMISLLLYLVLWQKVGLLFSNIRKKDKKTLKMLKYFSIYFIINIILLILTWPGIFRWDEFNIIHYVSFYKLEYWQNYMTSIFYLISYMLIPIPSGVIIIQILIASSIVSYILYNVGKIFKDTKLIYLMYIPFLLLPVLDHNLYPLRLTLYSYVEMLLICKIIFIKKLGECENKDCFLLAIILVVLSSLRTEGMLFLLLVPIIYLLMLKKNIPNMKKRIMYAFFTILLSVMLIIPQERVYKKKYSGQYEVTSYINQLHVVVKNELQNNPQSEELKKVAKVINMNEFMKYTRGIYAHNVGKLYNANATKQDYIELKKAYQKLLLKYPKDVFKERIDIFKKTSGFVDDYNVHVEDTRTIYTRPANKALKIFRTEYGKVTNPINLNLRNTVINILEGHNLKNQEETNITFNIFYNIVPSIIIMIIVSIVCIFKRKFIMPVILGVQLIKALAIIITAPDCFFMYYLPIYLTGYIIGFLVLIQVIYNKKREEKINILI